MRKEEGGELKGKLRINRERTKEKGGRRGTKEGGIFPWWRWKKREDGKAERGLRRGLGKRGTRKQGSKVQRAGTRMGRTRPRRGLRLDAQTEAPFVGKKEKRVNRVSL